MRPLLIAVLLFLVVSVAPASGQHTLRQATLNRYREATVFIRAERSRTTIATGSGVLIKRESRRGLIVTNYHVVERAIRIDGALKVVLNSGTKEERELDAKLVAALEARDLALLEVEAAHLPRPISLRLPRTVRETDPIFVLGFPFGVALATSKNPAMTIGQGTISSIRRDASGTVRILQIEGDVNPGNSGGPIISTGGDVLGICTAKVVGTRIGFAIPATTVDRLFEGGVHKVSAVVAKVKPGSVTLDVSARLSDPMGVLREVELVLVPKDRVSGKPAANEDGDWDPVAKDMQAFPLLLDGEAARAEIPLAGTHTDDVTYWMQAKYVGKSRKPGYTAPFEFTAPFGAARVLHDCTCLVAKRGGDPADGARQPAPDRHDWLGSPSASNVGPTAQDPRRPDGIGAQRTSPVEVKTAGGLRVTLARLGTSIGPGLQVVWSPREGAAYVLEAVLTPPGGTFLRKLIPPDFQEGERLQFAAQATFLGRCASGLLIGFTGLGELWLFDEKTLDPVRGFPLSEAGTLLASPQTNVIVVIPENRLANPSLMNVDSEVTTRCSMQLLTQAIESPAERTVFAQRHGSRQLVLSDDGSRLFWRIDKHLFRFRLQGGALSHEGPVVELPSERFVLTGAGTRLLCFADAVRDRAGRVERLPGYYEYDLAKSSLSSTRRIPGPARAAVVDAAATGDVYATDPYVPFVRFAPDGFLRGIYDAGALDAVSFLTHTGPGCLLGATRNQLVWFELGPVDAAPVRPPAPVAGGDSLAGEPNELAGLATQNIRVDAAQLVPNILWAASGRAFYALEASGTLRAFEVPSLSEGRRLEIGEHCSWIDRTRDGLLVTLDERQEVWLIDASSLEVTRRIPVAGADRAVSSPELDIAFANTVQDRHDGYHGTNARFAHVVDVARGAVARQFTAQDQQLLLAGDDRDRGTSRGWDFRLPAITPDGRYLLLRSESGVHRFRIEGTELTHEDVLAAPRPSGTSRSLEISPDSRYLSIGKAIYRVSDFREPVVELKEHPWAIGFDQQAGSLYGVCHSHLVRFAKDGSIAHDYDQISDQVVGLFVSPHDRSMLMLSRKHLIWIRLPAIASR